MALPRAFAFIERMNLNARERKLAGVLSAVAAALLFVALPVGAETWVHAKRDAHDEVRASLLAVQGARAAVRERQSLKDSIVLRYGKRAPSLAGFLEQNASAQKIAVADSLDRPDQPHGKRYVERHTVVHFKKVHMLPLAKFLESVEKSGYPVAVTRFNLRKRTGEPDSYDVEVGVSAYDRTEAPATVKEEKTAP